MKEKKKSKAAKDAAKKAAGKAAGKMADNAPRGGRRSRVYSISLPPELAARAEALAKAESRTMSELFREALRKYGESSARGEETRKWLDEVAEYVKTLPPSRYTEEDVPRLVKEVRAEMRAEREREARKAG